MYWKGWAHHPPLEFGLLDTELVQPMHAPAARQKTITCVKNTIPYIKNHPVLYDTGFSVTREHLPTLLHINECTPSGHECTRLSKCGNMHPHENVFLSSVSFHDRWLWSVEVDAGR
jgi:hypothetical protein